MFRDLEHQIREVNNLAYTALKVMPEGTPGRDVVKAILENSSLEKERERIMKTELTDEALEYAAQALAEACNGGWWDCEADYTAEQKDLWRRRVREVTRT